MRRSPNITAKFLPFATVLLLLLFWEIGVRCSHTPIWLLPAPSQVLQTLWDMTDLLTSHTFITVTEALSGFMLSIFIAFIIAVLMDGLIWLKQALYPLIIFSQTIPLIVLTVLFVIWFGFGILPKILVVILLCFFPILISLMDGLNSVDEDQIQLFRSMGAHRLAIFKMVKLPTAMPAFFSGLRISATYSIMGAVIGEWMGAEKGLGYFMTIAQKGFRIDQVLSAVIIICLLSLLLVKIIDLLEYILVPWNR